MKKNRITAEHIRKAAIIAYTECNMCKRCILNCPFGIDTAYMISIVRRICHRLGVTPLYLQDTAHSHSAFMNQMWVKEDEWIDTIHWQEEDAILIKKKGRLSAGSATRVINGLFKFLGHFCQVTCDKKIAGFILFDIFQKIE